MRLRRKKPQVISILLPLRSPNKRVAIISRYVFPTGLPGCLAKSRDQRVEAAARKIRGNKKVQGKMEKKERGEENVEGVGGRGGNRSAQ